MRLHTVPAVRNALASLPAAALHQPRSFAPVCDPLAQKLILGSMPSEEALRVREHYAHASDSLWKIMDALFGAGPCLPYEQRLRTPKQHRIAPWDVMQESDGHVRGGGSGGRMPNDPTASLRHSQKLEAWSVLH